MYRYSNHIPQKHLTCHNHKVTFDKTSIAIPLGTLHAHWMAHINTCSYGMHKQAEIPMLL